MDIKIKNIDYYLNLISGGNRDSCIKLFNRYKNSIEESPGSKVKHQAWRGGYLDHLCQCMALAEFLYEPIKNIGGVDFSLSDAILVIFIHDLEKPFKYVNGIHFHSDKIKFDFILNEAKRFDITLEDTHLNALKYIHGEGNDYDPIKNIQLPLAAFVHMCDVSSARIWYDIKN